MQHETLTELAADREVRKAAGFCAVATSLDGETLARLYRRQMETAPRRGEAGKKFFPAHDGTLPKRGAKRDEDQLAIALVNHAAELDRPLTLPLLLPGDDPGGLELLDYHVPLKLAAKDPGMARVDVLGVGRDDRLAVLVLRWLPASASRGSTGDTPLRVLLEGLAVCAEIEANGDALRAEIEERFGRKVSDAPPLLYVAASPRWWEIARRREAQKGARWINQMERLARLLEGSEERAETAEGSEAPAGPEALGIEVRFLSIVIEDEHGREPEPAWELRDDKPTLVAPLRLATAWESTAGRIKPKARARSKKLQASEPEIVEADLSRPVRPYSVTETYAAGDRIEHPTLGLGVVQAISGPTKIEVLFDDVKRVLVHDRPSPSA